VTILVTGGAGYIGRHVIRALAARGDEVAVVDLPELRDRAEAPFLGVDLAEPDAAEAVAAFADARSARAIVHLAARKRVDESVARPEWYRAQNVGGLTNVLSAARGVGIERVVFSSTAAVYASSDRPVTEDGRLAPANPYGETKLEGERLVADFADVTAARAISLRYFNVAGADDPSLAEHDAHNLIPLVVRKLVAGEPPVIYGDDYPTVDGTCVRDYIHVADLAEAHLAALDALASGSGHRVYNVGTGEGATVRDVIDHLTRISGSDVAPRVEPRRPGDPAIVVADPSRIHAELGWRAQRTLDDILASAWSARG
jgi:UDP-glucose 4-epimerase